MRNRLQPCCFSLLKYGRSITRESLTRSNIRIFLFIRLLKIWRRQADKIFMDDSEGIDKRRHKRSEIAYVIELKLLGDKKDQYTFRGYIEDVSDSGARIVFEDRYGRVTVEDITGSKIKLSITMPDGDRMALISTSRWARKDMPERFHIQVGIEFENIEQWQLDAIQNLVQTKNKDHSMMWNLWEHYERHA